jgi:hypothetical protein
MSEQRMWRRKPVVIAAAQWFKNGDHPGDGTEVHPTEGWRYEGKVVRYYRRPDVPGDRPCEQCHLPHDVHGWIDTLEQGHRVCPGDYIVTGIAGERYPVKPHIFTEIYEPAPPAVPPPAEQGGEYRDGLCIRCCMPSNERWCARCVEYWDGEPPETDARTLVEQVMDLHGRAANDGMYEAASFLLKAWQSTLDRTPRARRG